MILQTNYSVMLRSLAATTLALCLLAGCKSKQDAAIDQAKQQAVTTGQPQQVVMTGSDGSTTTTVIQPPLPGQTTQAITVTKTSTRAGSIAAATPAPVVGPAPISQGSGLVSTDAPVNSLPVAGNAASQGPINAANQGPVNVRIPAGTPLVIRINEHISVKTSRPGERFTGEVAEGVTTEGNSQILIPRGTPVFGRIDASHRRGHFKGASILELRLTSMTLNGQQYSLDTHDLVRTKKGKGKRSFALIGGGAGLGALIGGVATGGVGLLVGGLAGGGAGTAVAGLTGNRDLEIPAESLMRFRLADDLVVQPN